ESEARQDAMNALAGDTGGRALRNANFFDRWVSTVLDETSNYYVLAWRPDSEAERTPQFRKVQISVLNRPDLVVRAPRGYMPKPASTQAATNEKSLTNHTMRTPETELRDALADYIPSVDLTTTLSLTYLNTPKNEMLLNSSIQIDTNALGYGDDGKRPAAVRIAGVILNDKGKVAGSFKNQLNVAPMAGQSVAGGVIYNEHTPLSAGIYQVRVAARDESSGRLGSANQWIVIPDLATHQLTTSSILLGATLIKNESKDSEQVQFSVDHRFARSIPLRYWIFIYNAGRKSGAPNITIQSEVARNGQIAFTGATRNIVSSGPDSERIPFGDELSLTSLAPGKYELRVIVKDQNSGTTATQQTDFEIR
ncbi:MAG TPA: hypothetical protein VE863_12905, partial [Pyrinomonadaceae bacterium]|nr:hypothetical protein [Pyrinomonadaceae bacterium]